MSDKNTGIHYVFMGYIFNQNKFKTWIFTAMTRYSATTIRTNKTKNSIPNVNEIYCTVNCIKTCYSLLCSLGFLFSDLFFLALTRFDWLAKKSLLISESTQSFRINWLIHWFIRHNTFQLFIFRKTQKKKNEN